MTGIDEGGLGQEDFHDGEALRNLVAREIIELIQKSYCEGTGAQAAESPPPAPATDAREVEPAEENPPFPWSTYTCAHLVESAGRCLLLARQRDGEAGLLILKDASRRRFFTLGEAEELVLWALLRLRERASARGVKLERRPSKLLAGDLPGAARELGRATHARSDGVVRSAVTRIRDKIRDHFCVEIELIDSTRMGYRMHP